jgi:hypothetical protein
MHTFISKPKLPVTVYYTGKHVSCVFEDLQKRKAPNTSFGPYYPWWGLGTLCLVIVLHLILEAWLVILPRPGTLVT